MLCRDALICVLFVEVPRVLPEGAGKRWGGSSCSSSADFDSLLSQHPLNAELNVLLHLYRMYHLV